MVLRSVVLVLAIGAVWPQAAEALKCYSCSGSDCINEAVLGIQKECTAASDSCFTQFDGYVPIQRGCTTDLTGSDSCSGSSCQTCSIDYCNMLSATNHRCVICSSVLDDKCLSDAANLLSEQCGASSVNVTDAQCYSRVNGPVTERGCIRSQTDLDMCDGTQCSTCAGSSCNNGVFPLNRQKCAVCSSQLCNAYATTSFCALPDDNCVTAQRNDGTYLKTCEQAMSDADREFCETNPSACRFCTQNECNKNEINLQTSNRKCYTCQGTNCLHSSLEIGTCHAIDDDCFTIFDGFNPVRRGCSSTLGAQDKTICENNDNVDCDLCSDDLCNLLGREDHFCAYCSSAVNGNCITPDEQLNVVQCPAPTTEVTTDAQCYTRVIGTVTERGCLGSATDAERCDPTLNCETCSIENGNACNTRVFPADRRKCIVGSQANQYCPDPWDRCVQIAADVSGGSNVKKCQSSMSADEVSFCMTNSNKCDYCAGDNCNQEDVTFDYLECLSCDSQDNPACYDSPLSLASTALCQTCITILANNSQGQQVLQRGCLADLSPEVVEQCLYHNSTNSNAMCTSCSENRCNSAIYPEDRLACHTCSGSACFSHASIKLSYCPSYHRGDSCFIRLDLSGGLSHAGCLSMLNATEQANCKAVPSLCKTCDSSGCNDPGKYTTRASCVQCDSRLDETCVGRADVLEEEPCNDPLNGQCYTRLVGGLTTARGCLSDLDPTGKDNCARAINCTTCNSSTGKCNVEIYPPGRLACYQCLQPPCISHDTITLEYCPLYSNSDRCVMLTDTSGFPIRLGCNSTLTTAEQMACTSNPQHCVSGSESKSNDPAILLNSNKCVQCSSAYEPDCMGDAHAFEGLPCNDPTNTQCYTRFLDGRTTERGCLNSLNSSSKAECLQGINCAVCSSRIEKCNSAEYPMGQLKCYQCDSMENASCKNAQTGNASYCPSYNMQNQCYVRVLKDGTTVRKCSTLPRATECAGAELCEVCHFSKCNGRLSTAVMPTVIATYNSTTNTTTHTGAAAHLRSMTPVALIVAMIALATVGRHMDLLSLPLE